METEKMWKSDKFQPKISDASRALRRRFFEIIRQSEMNRDAVARKIFETGLTVLEKSFADKKSPIN